MTRRSIKLLFLGLALFGLIRLGYAGEQTAISAYQELEVSSYRLADRLATHGTSSLILPETYTKRGVWAEDRFIFPGAPEGSEVLISGDKIDDKPINTIQLQLKSGLTRTLEFSQVQAKPKLVLQFKNPSKVAGDNSVSSVYIRVYIGSRLLDRLRLTSDGEWVRKEYSLGNAQFLKQKLTLTLSMNCDSDESMLKLFGYLKS